METIIVRKDLIKSWLLQYYLQWTLKKRLMLIQKHREEGLQDSIVLLSSHLIFLLDDSFLKKRPNNTKDQNRHQW